MGSVSRRDHFRCDSGFFVMTRIVVLVLVVVSGVSSVTESSEKKKSSFSMSLCNNTIVVWVPSEMGSMFSLLSMVDRSIDREKSRKVKRASSEIKNSNIFSNIFKIQNSPVKFDDSHTAFAPKADHSFIHIGSRRKKLGTLSKQRLSEFQQCWTVSDFLFRLC